MNAFFRAGVACMGLPAVTLHAQPLSTAFTYQGDLKAAGSPATGLHDLQFRLFDAAAAGNAVGPTLCINNISLTDGRFTAQLDFGSVFNGQRRYLEVAIRADLPGTTACAVTTGYTTLTSRQELTLTPHAAYALSAANATTANSATTATSATSATNSTQLNGQNAAYYRDATNVNNGTLADIRLSSNVALLSGVQTFTGSKTFSSPPAFTASSPFTVTSSTLIGNLNADLLDGQSGGFYSNAGNLTGTLLDARLSSNVALLAGAQTFTGAKTFSNGSNSFTGSGAGLTLLNASNLSDGTVSDARLSTNVPLLNVSNVFSASQSVVGSAQIPLTLASTNTGGTWLNLSNSSSGARTWNLFSSGSSNGEGPGKLLVRDASAGVRMAVDTLGNVGIGTTSPQQRLSIVGGLGIDEGDANSGSVNNSLRFGSFSGEAIGSARTGSSNVFGLDFYTAGEKRVSITNSGHVGIGTTSPAGRFHVQGAQQTGVQVNIPGPSTGTAGSGATQQFISPASGEVASITITYSSGESTQEIRLLGAQGTLATKTITNLPLGLNLQAVFVFDAPRPVLLQGATYAVGWLATETTVPPILTPSIHYNGNNPYPSGTSNVGPNVDLICSIVYGTTEGGAFIVTDDGKVGINTSSPPSVGLTVAGSALVTGTLSKGAGSFQIDHPLDPANKFLFHSFVESPDMMNIYNGNARTGADGFATITLPDWFSALNRDYRYQLTVIDDAAPDAHFARIARKIDSTNTFVIKTIPGNLEVSWQVTGIRHDAFANANRIPTEVDKSAESKGKYLHPEAFDQPASTGLYR